MARWRTVDGMSAQTTEVEEFPYPVITGEAVVVPIAELRRLRAIERHASPDVIAEAEAEEAGIAESLARYRAWMAAGRPNEERHEDVKAELLAELNR